MTLQSFLLVVFVMMQYVGAIEECDPIYIVAATYGCEGEVNGEKQCRGANGCIWCDVQKYPNFTHCKMKDGKCLCEDEYPEIGYCTNNAFISCKMTANRAIPGGEGDCVPVDIYFAPGKCPEVRAPSSDASGNPKALKPWHIALIAIGSIMIVTAVGVLIGMKICRRKNQIPPIPPQLETAPRRGQL